MRVRLPARVMVAALLIGSPLLAGGQADPLPPPAGGTALQRLLDRLPPDLAPGSRRMMEGLLSFEAPLTPAAIASAEKARRVAQGRASRLSGPCDPAALPLDVAYANYTIGLDGLPIPGSTGWTTEEREQFSRFLCRMLPVLRDHYGDPFQRWAVTLVKDLGYSQSWIFIPSLLEIHSAGGWNPRLLTHEFIHAFRGQRLLTSDASWNYVPTLSGFEEGFAEGMAYVAMNEYVRLFCSAGDCSEADVPSFTFWYSYLESSYDFANDASLTCEDFWSDYGGTLKLYERYLMAASAIMRLETAVPGFSRRFNEEYYTHIRNDAAYRPSREAVVAIVEALTPAVDGIPARSWIGHQHIFDSRTLVGKRDWIANYTPASALDEDRMSALMFLETFPRGSEWAEYIPDCPRLNGTGFGDYLYYRLHGTRGEVQLTAGGFPVSPRRHAVTMQNDPDTTYSVVGCNHVLGEFAVAEIHRVLDPAQCVPFWVPSPTCIVQPPAFGLYSLRTSWRNPQYGLQPGPPAYAMPYDAGQDRMANAYPMLAGRMPAGYDRSRHRLAGGVMGLTSGTVRITHSARPGTVVAPISNGAFFAEPPTCPAVDDGSCWVVPFASWTEELVMVPGTLAFDVAGSGGVTLTEKRTIGLSYQGRHEFLLQRQ